MHSQIGADVACAGLDVRCYVGAVCPDDHFVTNAVCQDVVILLERVNGREILVKQRCSPLRCRSVNRAVYGERKVDADRRIITTPDL